jgi:hypothetical protein
MKIKKQLKILMYMKTIRLIQKSTFFFICFNVFFCFCVNAQLKVTQTGNVGLGTTPQTEKLSIASEYYPAVVINETGHASFALGIDVGYPSTLIIGGSLGGTDYFTVSASGVRATAYYTFSDLNRKQNIATIESPLEKVLKLRGVTYQSKSLSLDNLNLNEDEKKSAEEWMGKEYSKKRIGIIAQEIEPIVPEVVSTNENGEKSIAYSDLIGLLVEAIKEQQLQIEELKNNAFPVLFRSDASGNETTGILNKSSESCYLYQNIPNPFSQSTQIKFYLPQNIKTASLNIYNLQGKQLKQVVITQRGESSQLIAASEFDPGIYLYALIADGREADVKRMILTE